MPWPAQLADAPPSFLKYLRFLCVADGKKAWDTMGFRPAYTTREALLDFTSAQRLRDVHLLHEPTRMSSETFDDDQESGGPTRRARVPRADVADGDPSPSPTATRPRGQRRRGAERSRLPAAETAAPCGRPRRGGEDPLPGGAPRRDDAEAPAGPREPGRAADAAR